MTAPRGAALAAALPITFGQVLDAEARLKPHLTPTPLRNYPQLDEMVGHGVQLFVKHENHQPTQSFKIRNGLNAVLGRSAAERARGCIGASTGNHGLGIAYAGRLSGTSITVCVPEGNNPEKNAAIRALGATHVLDRDGAGEGPAEFDVILDVVGGSGLPAFIGRLAPNGRLVAVGIVGGQPPADFGTAILSAFRRSIWFGTLSLDTVPRADLARVRAELFDAAARGELHAVVHDVLPLAGAADAHRRMDAGEVFGRIVLTP